MGALHFVEYRRLIQIFKMTEAAAAKPAKAKKPAKKAEHPPSGVMVLAAVKALKDKKGSSLPAIKKYIAANFKVDVAKISPFIRKAIKKLVADKKLIQNKASFKAAKEEKPKKVKKPKAKKPKAKKPKKTAAKKTPKKAKKTAAKKAKTAKKAPAKKAKTAKKAPAKKTAKKPAAKKSPKKAAKKAAPKKK